jgi:hypothetical protein
MMFEAIEAALSRPKMKKAPKVGAFETKTDLV